MTVQELIDFLQGVPDKSMCVVNEDHEAVKACLEKSRVYRFAGMVREMPIAPVVVIEPSRSWESTGPK